MSIHPRNQFTRVIGGMPVKSIRKGRAEKDQRPGIVTPAFAMHACPGFFEFAATLPGCVNHAKINALNLIKE